MVGEKIKAPKALPEKERKATLKGGGNGWGEDTVSTGNVESLDIVAMTAMAMNAVPISINFDKM